MIKRLVWMILLIIVFTQCGIPSSNLYEEINTPKNLTVTHNGSNITITFKGYNPELTFTGYNVYMHDSTEAELRSLFSLHVNAERIVNIAVEKDYIVQNTLTISYPTIIDSDAAGVSEARDTAYTITYTITKGPNERPLGIISWFIGVSAYSAPNHLESGLSEVIQAIP